MTDESRLKDVEEAQKFLRDADRLQGRRMSAAAPSAADVPSWNVDTKKWEPALGTELTTLTDGSGADSLHSHNISQILDRDLTQVDVADEADETSLYSFTIPADTLGELGGFRLFIAGDMLVDDGGGNTLRLRVKLGGTTILSSDAKNLQDNAERYKWGLEVWCMNSATDAQKWGLTLIAGASSSTWPMPVLADASGLVAAAYNTSAKDTTGDLLLDVTADWSAADADNSIRKEMAILELLSTESTSGGGGTTDHGSLSGLGDDDHDYAPTAADYLVGTASGNLSNEIVAGTSPGGELGGTWGSPTVDGTHSGSAHHAQSHAPESHTDTDITGAELEELSDESETTLHSHAGGGGGGTLTTIKENDVQVGGADIEILDFLGADFDLAETPDKEIQVVIAAAIARTAALHAQAHTLGSHSTEAIDELSDVDTTTSAPALNEVLKWDGSNFVPGLAGDTTEFTFTLDSFTGSGVGGTELIGLGDWKAIAAIQFDAGYTNPPGGLTATVALTGAANPWGGDLSMTGTPPDGPTTNTEAVEWPSGRAGTLTFTITPSDSPTPATLADAISFANTMRYGTNALTIGNQTEGSLEALSEVSGPNESRSQTISNISADAGKYLTFAWATALAGNVAQVQINTGTGYVTASFNSTATTLAPTVSGPVANVANSKSFSESFESITSRIADLQDGSNDFKLLTSSTALDYIMWGEQQTDAGADGTNQYNEAAVEDTSRGSIVVSNSISSRNMTVTGGDGSYYAFIAYPARLGALSSILIGGFESIGDFWIDADPGNELAVTNDGGYTEDYYVYVAKNPGFGSGTTMVVSL